ncbi:MAG: imidazoleglycerol-phosphate dehydratase HisB [Acholeplasmataceae bacterium]|nr:MAG: imidazoleglycerol-phosphate dehydratase HisB [Acholeplasmataceae bacterium]
MRQATLDRNTNETRITLSLNLDQQQANTISTGIPFLDHMLDLMAFHGKFAVTIECQGDLAVDDHHTVEDVGIVFGQALLQALGDKKGIRRYGSSLVPMDEALARAVIDISGRPTLVFQAALRRERLGTLATENVKEFFKAVVNEAKMTVHLAVLYGENEHHQVEAMFKAFGQALRQAITIEGTSIPSTKGVLG